VVDQAVLFEVVAQFAVRSVLHKQAHFVRHRAGGRSRWRLSILRCVVLRSVVQTEVQGRRVRGSHTLPAHPEALRVLRHTFTFTAVV
jgi:hypothetical protein